MSGVCTPPSCASGQAMCAGVCRNLATDKANCGSCDTVCVMGHTCLEGICTGLGICGQPGTSPTQEICGDSLDNDCDGIVDESGCVKGTSTTGGTTSTGTSKCGNGVIDPGERCDGDNVGSARCPPATIGGPECSLTALVSLYFVKRDDDTQSQTHHHLPLRVAGFVTE